MSSTSHRRKEIETFFGVHLNPGHPVRKPIHLISMVQSCFYGNMEKQDELMKRDAAVCQQSLSDGPMRRQGYTSVVTASPCVAP